MFGFSVEGNCVMPIVSESRSAAAADKDSSSAATAGMTLRLKAEGARRDAAGFSRKTLVRSTEIALSLGKPVSRSYGGPIAVGLGRINNGRKLLHGMERQWCRCMSEWCQSGSAAS